jgi:hypothetical protein
MHMTQVHLEPRKVIVWLYSGGGIAVFDAETEERLYYGISQLYEKAEADGSISQTLYTDKGKIPVHIVEYHYVYIPDYENLARPKIDTEVLHG